MDLNMAFKPGNRGLFEIYMPARPGPPAALNLIPRQAAMWSVQPVRFDRAYDILARIMSDIRRAVLEAIGATPDVVLLVQLGTVPKTSSGKIQRDLMRKRYRKGNLKPERPSVVTLLRLKVATTLQQVRGLSVPNLLASAKRRLEKS